MTTRPRTPWEPRLEVLRDPEGNRTRYTLTVEDVWLLRQRWPRLRLVWCLIRLAWRVQ